MTPLNLHGQRFGRWFVLTEDPNRLNGRTSWLCRCDCGTERSVATIQLTSGLSKSCGCLRREMGVARGRASKKHGEGTNGKETVEYRTWSNMMSRCRNPNHKMYRHYGARGITVCARWHSFENFLADMGRRPDKYHSLDRINNDGNYEPGNVRWATSEQQNNNTRHNRRLEIDGSVKTLSEWCREAGISAVSFRRRKREGMTDKDALFSPIRGNSGKPLRVQPDRHFNAPVKPEEVEKQSVE